MPYYRKTIGDRLFDFTVYFLAFLIVAITLYPLVYTFSMAISEPIRAARGEVFLLPKGFDLTAIRKVLSNGEIASYYGNTLWYTSVGTALGILFSCLAAYPLSRKEFKYRSFFAKYILFTMFFSGGMIPTYIVVAKYMHLYNTRWALVLPQLTTAWYVLVTKNYFEGIPEEIVESARIDGASEYRIFLQLFIPLSKPVIAVLALYYAVSYWNGYFHAMLYLAKKELQPLSLYVRSVVIQNSLASIADAELDIDAAQLLSSLQLKYAVIVVAVVPMLLIYPFLSKNLEKGLLIGSVKG